VMADQLRKPPNRDQWVFISYTHHYHHHHSIGICTLFPKCTNLTVQTLH
jgi:hypothetical protein